MLICTARPGRIYWWTPTGQQRELRPNIYAAHRFWRRGHSTRGDELRRILERDGLSAYIQQFRRPLLAAQEED